MSSLDASRYQANSTVASVLRLVDELRCAEAVCLLYSLHKNDVLEWVEVKRLLLRISMNHRSLSLITMLLNASTGGSLSESCSIVPGLYAIVCKTND